MQTQVEKKLLITTVEFYLVDFMKMIHAKQNTYQRKQFLEFFDNLIIKNSSLIKSLENCYSSQL